MSTPSLNPNNIDAELAANEVKRKQLLAAKRKMDAEAEAARQAEEAKKIAEAKAAERAAAQKKAAEKGKGKEKVGEASGSGKKVTEWKEDPKRGACPRCARRDEKCEWPIGGRGKSCKTCNTHKLKCGDKGEKKRKRESASGSEYSVSESEVEVVEPKKKKQKVQQGSEGLEAAVWELVSELRKLRGMAEQSVGALEALGMEVGSMRWETRRGLSGIRREVKKLVDDWGESGSGSRGQAAELEEERAGEDKRPEQESEVVVGEKMVA
jgi:hypothetical protein